MSETTEPEVGQKKGLPVKNSTHAEHLNIQEEEMQTKSRIVFYSVALARTGNNPLGPQLSFKIST